MTKQYDSYKPSGVEWLGDIPSHWGQSRVANIFKRQKQLGFEKEELLSVYRDWGVIPKSSRSDNHNKPSDDLSKYQLVEVGDLVLNKMKTWQGSIAISKYKGIVSPAYFVYKNINIFEEMNLDYFHYMFRSPIFIKNYIQFSKGVRVNQWDIEDNKFRNLNILIPTLKEQTAIANYLDNKTTAIDGSIETLKVQKKTLIEQKKSIIHKAVTQGLDSSVPMKDSGVEWIGMVPEHWDLKKWKNILTILNGFAFKSTDHDESENGMPIVKMSNLKNGSLFLDTAQKVKFKKEYSPYILKDGDLLLGMSGSIENFAFVKESDGLCALNQRVCSIKSIKTTNKYIQYFIQGSSYRQKIRVNALGTAIMNLSSDDLRNMEIAISDISEQQQIVDYLDRKTSKIDESVAEVDKQIGLLEEYKKTLINDVVTGKKRVYEGEI